MAARRCRFAATAMAEPQTWLMTGVKCACARAKNPQVLADSAQGTDFGLGNVEPTILEDPPPAPAIELGLPARDVDLEPGAQFPVALEILRRDRFFKPVGTEFFQRSSDIERIRCRVAAIGIDHEAPLPGHARRDRFAKSHICPRPQSDLHLGGTETHVEDHRGFIAKTGDVIFQAFAFEHHAVTISGNLGSMRASDQLVKRQTGDFSRDVPERNVNPGKRL